jgi:hypothetical protein
LNHFCNDCLTNIPPEKDPGRLETEVVYKEYLEYCQLYNVTTPAVREQIGEYLSLKFNVQSVTTSKMDGDKKKSYRYYPGLYLAKSAKLAYAEDKMQYYHSYYSITTPLLQQWIGEIDSSKDITTATTAKVLNEVLLEIEKIFNYIQSCDDVRDISFSSYMESVGQKAVVAVVAVVMDRSMPIFPTTANKDAVVEKDGAVVEDRLMSPSKAISTISEKQPTLNQDDTSSGLRSKALHKRTCSKCGKIADHDLPIDYPPTCYSCHAGYTTGPTRPDPQTTLDNLEKANI